MPQKNRQYTAEDYARLFKRIEEDFDIDKLTEQEEKDILKKMKQRKTIPEILEEFKKIKEKIEIAPSKEILRDINKDINKLPIKKEELKIQTKERRKELTPIEKLAKEKKIRLSRFRIGKIENHKDGTQWITIRNYRKGKEGQIITSKKIK